MQAVQKVTGSTFGRNAQEAKSKIAELARALSGNDADMTRAEAFQSLISTLLADTSALAGLGDTDRAGVVEFLQNIAEAANSLEPDDANGWNTLLTTLMRCSTLPVTPWNPVPGSWVRALRSKRDTILKKVVGLRFT